MKRFYIFGKFMLKLILGGLIGFAACTVALYMKGYNIAADMARDMSIVASEYGCVNSDVMDVMMHSFKTTYSVSNRNLSDAEENFYAHGGASPNGHGGITRHGGEKYFVFDYRNGYEPYITVKDSAGERGNSLINAPGADYVNHVQRGSTIYITATAHVRLYLPFKLLNRNDNMHDGISNDSWTEDILSGQLQLTPSKSMVCISTKFYKGELDN